MGHLRVRGGMNALEQQNNLLSAGMAIAQTILVFIPYANGSKRKIGCKISTQIFFVRIAIQVLRWRTTMRGRMKQNKPQPTSNRMQHGMNTIVFMARIILKMLISIELLPTNYLPTPTTKVLLPTNYLPTPTTKVSKLFLGMQQQQLKRTRYQRVRGRVKLPLSSAKTQNI